MVAVVSISGIPAAVGFVCLVLPVGCQRQASWLSSCFSSCPNLLPHSDLSLTSCLLERIAIGAPCYSSSAMLRVPCSMLLAVVSFCHLRFRLPCACVCWCVALAVRTHASAVAASSKCDACKSLAPTLSKLMKETENKNFGGGMGYHCCKAK